ncbi:pentapeptide repeat-containing protein [Polymorphospora rubra]|uniref:pentapeptide repeat-containing protein n=1 Tax=Polymorphospora rubra TaxID=338584 RepID=UPI0033F46722
MEEFVDALRAGLGGPDPLFPELIGIDLDLRDADISAAPMENALLNSSRLDGVVARDASLAGAELGYATLSGADFSGATLYQADLHHATARAAVFRAANLARLNADDADLRDADLTGALLVRARFVGADLRGADLRGSDLGDWIDLRTAKVARTRFDGLVGVVRGPVDVGDSGRPHLLDGPELTAWFRDHDAPGLTVAGVGPPPSQDQTGAAG